MRWSPYSGHIVCIQALSPPTLTYLYFPSPEAEFLDEIQTKVSRVSLFAFYSHLYSLEISISSYSRNLLRISTVQLLYSVKEKRGKADRNPYPLPYVLINLYRNLRILKQCWGSGSATAGSACFYRPSGSGSISQRCRSGS
jgi:hypothetical protein